MRAAAPVRGVDMNYGPFLCYTVQGTNGSNDVTCKGITVALTAGTNRAYALFDTDTLRYSAIWSGGWLNLSKTHLTTEKGELPPRIAGRISWANPDAPGWMHDGGYIDPRANKVGPLPRDWAHYLGLYRCGSNVVFRYSVSGCEILDMPGLIESKGFPFFTRTLRVEPSDKELVVRLRDAGCDTLPPGVPCPSIVVLEGKGVQARLNSDHLEAAIAPHANSITAKFLFVDSEHGQAIPFDNLDQIHAPDLPDVSKGGPALWSKTVVTRGRRGPDNGPFTVDTATLPETNPYRSWMRTTALDFFLDGRVAVATWNGDVWIASNLDDGLQAVTWKRFAAGLFDPLGLKVFHDEVYVMERSQITRLRDLNGDGEADAYENFNNDTGVSPSYHAFAMDLQTDSHGNFYFARASQRVDPKYPLNGGMVRVPADGSRAEMIAHGLRVANGMAIGPNDEIVCSDNQGNWMPSSRLNLVLPGPRFYGYVPHAHGLATNVVPPLCWIPMSLDNSSGGEVFVTGDRWPETFRSHLLHTSYGMASLFHVLWEVVDGVPQGGVMQFPLRFDSGIMRARFNPRDGQLWVTGLRGWQTKGLRDGCLQRVRYTGKPLRMPTELHVRKEGIELTFSDPLDRAAAEDLQSWSVTQWNYRWTEKYGSDDYSVKHPAEKGHDDLAVTAIKLSPDGKRVVLMIPDLRPVMQMRIKYSLQAQDGTAIKGEIDNTINIVK